MMLIKRNSFGKEMKCLEKIVIDRRTNIKIVHSAQETAMQTVICAKVTVNVAIN